MKQLLKGLIGACIVLIASAVFVLGTVVPGTATPVKIACTPSKVVAEASTATATNNTTTYAAIPEASLAFTQGGTKASCVIVLFSTIANAKTTGFYLRALLDGATAGLPVETYFHDDDTALHTDTATFIFNDVSPGTHNVKLQFHSSGGNAVSISSHNLIISFVP